MKTLKLLHGLISSLLLLTAPIVRADTIGIEWSLLSERAGGAKGALQLVSGEILATHTEWNQNEVQSICSRSTDGGKSWEKLSVIARDGGRADVGDGHLLELPTGEVLFSYRHNVIEQGKNAPHHYSIRVAVSRDRGETWLPHSTVAISSHDPEQDPGALRGLWSSFLLLTADGSLHCFYDDEETPHQNGFRRHQWLTMKTWDNEAGVWTNPVTVSRAHQVEHLSRDGMPSVVELPNGRLLCAFESVQTTPPHANCVRLVTSDDGGNTWSWKREKRKMLFEPAGTKNALALSPWLARLPAGELICVFATDEDREIPGVSGTPPAQLSMDIKYVISSASGQTWSRSPQTIFSESHRSYLPGVIPLKDRSLLVTFLDFADGKCRAMAGAIMDEGKR